MSAVSLPIATFVEQYPAVAARYDLGSATRVVYVPAGAVVHDVVYVHVHDVCVIVDEYAQVCLVYDAVRYGSSGSPRTGLAEFENNPKQEDREAVRPDPSISSGVNARSGYVSKVNEPTSVRPACPAELAESEDPDKRRGEPVEGYRTYFYASQHASITYTAAHMGSFSHHIELHLLGTGASITVNGIYGLTNTQRCTITTKQEHTVPGATSSVLIKGIVGGQAYAEYTGMITITEQGAQSNANQQAATLLISPQARAKSIPSLQVLTNDVRCKHGSAVGQLNQDQLFYAQARGLSPEQAQRLLLQGFLAQAMTHMPDAYAQVIMERIIALV